MRLSHFAARLALAAIVFFFAFAAPSGHADELQDAIEAVKQASDADLLAELQRRHEARRDIPVTPDKAPGGRDVTSGLGHYDDATLLRAIKANGRVIYGADDRKDWHQIEDAAIKGLASATVALFSAADIQPDAAGSVKLNTRLLGEAAKLCKGEAFAEQATGAYCSGTLVKEDVVLTAGHCVREISGNADIPYTASVRFVFGYRVEAPGTPGRTVIPEAQIFKGQVIAGELAKDNGPDWALVKLGRPVPQTVARPVTNWRAAEVAVGADVFVIGHPSGLPIKYAPGASIRDAVKPAFFTANLDTFGGNSGSGVFDAATNELIGVLVRGDTDYVPDETGSCARVNSCPATGCKGEDVTRISIIAKAWGTGR